MNEQNLKIAISYNLFADGILVESKSEDEPMTFITGISPIFEKILMAITKTKVGDNFSVEFNANEMLPPQNPDAIVTLDKNDFIQDETTMEDLNEIFIVGKQVPMNTSDGEFVLGTVKSVEDNTVVMDFNHPLSDKQLKFEGKVISSTTATHQEILEEHLANASFHPTEESNEESTEESCDCVRCQCDSCDSDE